MALPVELIEYVPEKPTPVLRTPAWFTSSTLVKLPEPLEISSPTIFIPPAGRILLRQNRSYQKQANSIQKRMLIGYSSFEVTSLKQLACGK